MRTRNDSAHETRRAAWTRRAGRLAPILALGLASVAVQAQYFGRNKVLWDEFDFKILETEHFRIHYYAEGEEQPSAQYVARLAERWYARLSAFFDHDFREKKPLIIYRDHADFQQTTTTPGLIGQGTGGFTESIQNRVVLPLTGINADNNHVLGHELVHAFQYDMSQQPPGQQRPRPGEQPEPRQQVQRLPLWAVEGLAEYLSQGRHDPHTALYMRDLVLHENLPDMGAFIQRQPSPYQYGQAVWAYVGGEWGDDVVSELYKQAARVGTQQAFMDVLGLEQQAFFEQLHDALRSAYEPVLDGRFAADAIAEPLLTLETTGAGVNVAPSLSPDGRWIAFLSTREFAMELYLADTETGEIDRKLVTADSDPHYDSLSFLDSSVAWSPDGTRFVFPVFARGERRLAVYDLERGKVERRLDVPGVDGMRHPAWSPDGERIVFSAISGNASDLYMIDLASGGLDRLTNDDYTAVQPAFSPDGSELVFVTDRAPGTNLRLLEFADLNLARLDLETREIEVLPMFREGQHLDPKYSPDGRSLYFVAEPEGVPDLYRYDFADGRIVRLTALNTGVAGITDTSPALSIAAETGKLAMSVLADNNYSIYRYTPDEGTPVGETTSEVAAGVLPPLPREGVRRIVESYLDRPELGLPPESRTFERQDYEADIGLANIGPATIGVGQSDLGSYGRGSFGAYFADTLNRHQIVTTVQGGGSSGGVLDFSDTIGAEVAYLNQANRFLWGGRLGRLPYLTSRAAITREPVEIDGTVVPADVVNRLYRIVTDQSLEMLGQYPLSINNRFEVSAGASRIGFDNKLERTVFPIGAPPFREEIDLPAPETLDLTSASAAFVRDTSRFGFVSPLRGARFRVETTLTSGDLDFRTDLIDFRKYWLARPVTLALRATHVGRRGSDAQDARLAPLDIARGTLVRGYSFDSFDASECTRGPDTFDCPELDRLVGTRIAALNFEVRVPLLGNEEYGFFNVPAAPTELFFFTDVGAAWTADESVDVRYDTDTTDRVPVVSYGIGVRTLVLGSLPLELYYADPQQRPEAGTEFGFRIRAGW